MWLVEVRDIGAAFKEYWGGLDGAVEAWVHGVTRSMDLDPYDELCGFVLRGRGLVDGVYGSEKLTEEAGVCEREGAALKVTWEVEARL